MYQFGHDEFGIQTKTTRVLSRLRVPEMGAPDEVSDYLLSIAVFPADSPL
jgi:hypothetical protein